MTAAELQAIHRGSPGEAKGAAPVVAPGALAIRVRRHRFAARLIVADAPPPRFGVPMDACCDSPSGWGHPPRTFARVEDAEAERAEWERYYAAGGYSFDLVERVLVPSWRAVGGETR